MLPGSTIGPYRLVRKLGEGGMGQVYEAMHQIIARRVAIKVLRPQYAHDRSINKRFVNEARAVNLINHPGLVQISDFGELPSGCSYIVMEYLSGETLGQRLKRLQGPLLLSQVLHVGWQVAAALAAAHEKNIVHRDLKPDNIMLTRDADTPDGERAKLLDFGIARLDAELAGTGTQTLGSLTLGKIMGTPAYMSPEQCSGDGGVDGKSDVYSFGVLLYQLLGGRLPFIAQGPMGLIRMHLGREPPPLHDLAPHAPAKLVALVHQLLLKDPAQRPSMRQVLLELEQMQSQQGSTGGPAEHLLPDLLGGTRQASPPTLQGAGATAILVPAKTAEIRTVQQEVRGFPLVVRSHPALRETPTVLPESPTALNARWSAVVAALLAGVVAIATMAIFRHPGAGKVYVNLPGATQPVVAQGSATAASQPALAVPPEPKTVYWSLDSLPSGATVMHVGTGQVLGTTPWRGEHVRADGSFLVRLQYPGFAERELRLDFGQGSSQTERLTQLSSSAPRAPSPRGLPTSQKLPRLVTPLPAKSPETSSGSPFLYIE